MNTITASFPTAGFEGKAPDAIVFFPKGEHTVVATKDDKPFQVTVNATADLAGVLNAQLQEARNAAATGTASRPFIDFGHKGDAAAAIPTEIYWDEDKGVMCSVEWTASGKSAIEGKDYSYFSPEFKMAADGNPSLFLPYCPIGGLVNTPAFQSIGPIAASLNQQPDMTNIIAAMKKFGVEVKDDADETAICSAFEQKLTQLTNDLTTAKASLASYEAKEKEAVAAALASEAESVVSAALADGKIEANAKDTWIGAYKASPETVKAQLGSIKAKADGHSGPVKTVTAAAGGKGQPITCSLAEFKALSPDEKLEFSQKGGRIA